MVKDPADPLTRPNQKLFESFLVFEQQFLKKDMSFEKPKNGFSVEFLKNVSFWFSKNSKLFKNGFQKQ